jgi:hypothetical protein
MLKAEAWPLSRDAPTWRADAKDALTPSMRQKIDVASLYREARQTLPETVDGQQPLPILTELPTLDTLLSED